MKMRNILAILVLALMPTIAFAQASTKPQDETIDPIIQELGIPMENPSLIATVLGLQSKPRGDCDRARHAPAVTGTALQVNCGIDLGLLYSKVKDATVQIFVRTRGTVLIGTAFKLCHDTSKQCFYVSSLHVAEVENYVGIVAADKKTVQYAAVVARNPAKDLMLLAVPDGDTRPSLKAGAPPRLNESAFTVGHPYGFPEDVITAGQIAYEKATGQAVLPHNGQVLTIHDLFVVDAHVLEGNSGGPAFNALGEVIGIDCMASNASAALPNGGAFMVPIVEATSLIDKHIKSQALPTK